MTASNPASVTAALFAPPVARRTGSGHVLSYGDGRICAAPGCGVRLSRYNGTPYCASSQHARHAAFGTR